MRLPSQITAVKRGVDRNAMVMAGSVGPSAKLSDLLKPMPLPMPLPWIPDFRPGPLPHLDPYFSNF